MQNPQSFSDSSPQQVSSWLTLFTWGLKALELYQLLPCKRGRV